MSSFIDVLGDSVDNIKTVNDYLNKEDVEYLTSAAKKAESNFNGTQLHVPAFNYLDDDSLNDLIQFSKELNNKIFITAKELYGQDFLEETFNFGLNILMSDEIKNCLLAKKRARFVSFLSSLERLASSVNDSHSKTISTSIAVFSFCANRHCAS